MKSVPRLAIDEAVAKVRSGDTLIVGGFGLTGNPIHLLHALAATEVTGLTYIGNNLGEPDLAGGRCLRKGQIKKAIGSFFTTNPEAVAAAQAGELEVELLPQGTLAEAIRAGGAGLGGFFTPTGAGTTLGEGRETRIIDGKKMMFVPPLRADVALVRAWRADTAGNLQYRMTENNFNQAAATAAALVIAEVEEIVEAGQLPPDCIHTPGCFVDCLVQATLAPQDLGTSESVAASLKKTDETRMMIARAALAELQRGDVVNLGVGLPALVADLARPEDGLILHSENGMLGMGPEPASGDGAMRYPVNAGKSPVTALPGASYFDSAASFAMIRGGHVDVAIMGGLQVDEEGNLANWAVPGKPLLGVGGAMDLASGAKKLIVVMLHCDRDGASKVVRRCALPLTARRAVDVLITDLAVFRFDAAGMRLAALMPGVEPAELRRKTTARYAGG